jgi:hypothetical protein
VTIRSLLLLAAAAAALPAINGCAGSTVMPTSYKTYNASDGSFRIQYPDGWEVKAGGSRGYVWAKFTSGTAELLVDTNVAGSVIGDLSKMKTPVPLVETEGPQEAPSVEKVHKMEKADFVQEMGVEEQEPTAIATGFGDSRRSEFTGSRAFGGAIHGCRVTTLSRDRRIRVVCTCSESEWQALKPAFDKMISGVAMGEGAF